MRNVTIMNADLTDDFESELVWVNFLRISQVINSNLKALRIFLKDPKRK